jgi:hypothetical protein
MSHAVVASLLSALLFSPLLVAAQDTSTLRGFEAAFRRANASKDFRALEQLVWWAHAKPKACEEMRNVLSQEFGHPIRRIDTERFSWAHAIYAPRNPNLRPAHFFTVWSVTGRDRFGTQITGTFCTLGRKDGRFYFIVSDQWPVMSMHYERT